MEAYLTLVDLINIEPNLATPQMLQKFRDDSDLNEMYQDLVIKIISMLSRLYIFGKDNYVFLIYDSSYGRQYPYAYSYDSKIKSITVDGVDIPVIQILQGMKLAGIHINYDKMFIVYRKR